MSTDVSWPCCEFEPYQSRPPASAIWHEPVRLGAAKLSVFTSVAVSITSIVACPQRAT